MYFIQNTQSNEKLTNTLNLLKLIVQSENDIRKNNLINQEVMFNNLEQKLFG